MFGYQECPKCGEFTDDYSSSCRCVRERESSVVKNDKLYGEKMEEIEIEFEVDAGVSFDNEQGYIVGWDITGDGVRFDNPEVCYNKEDLIDEIHRVVYNNDFDCESFDINEVVVVAQIVDAKITYQEYEVIKTRKPIIKEKK